VGEAVRREQMPFRKMAGMVEEIFPRNNSTLRWEEDWAD
jgi:hypothetical protein